MMTTSEPTEPPKDWGILENSLISFEAAPPDLLDQVRVRVNRYPDVPHSWVIGNGQFDHQLGMALFNLQFGITAAENTGVLSWYDDDDRQYRPAVGINTDAVEYQMAGVHTTYFEIGMVVPADLVYAAVEEHLRTHERPTCLEWLAVDDDQ